MKKILFFFIFMLSFAMICQPAMADKAEEWYQRGVCFQKNSVYGEAIKALTEAIRYNPKDADAYFQRGKAYFSLNPDNCVEAIKDFTKVIELDPMSAETYYERGLLHAYVMNNAQATSDMHTAARLGHRDAQRWLNPDSVIPEVKYVNLGDCLCSKDEPIVYFDFDSAHIKPQYYAFLSEIGEILKCRLPKVKLVLAGHADDKGSLKYNDALSLRRAKAVKKYLVEKRRIDPRRIIVKGLGEKDPIAINDSVKGRAMNRRVELIGAEII